MNGDMINLDARRSSGYTKVKCSLNKAYAIFHLPNDERRFNLPVFSFVIQVLQASSYLCDKMYYCTNKGKLSKKSFVDATHINSMKFE